METSSANAVAEVRNLEDCVRKELESARAWSENWGSLYGGGMSMPEKIKSLEDELARLKGQPLFKTNSQLTYTPQQPFPTFQLGAARTKAVNSEEVDELAATLQAKQHAA